MHATTSLSLAEYHHRDLAVEAAKSALASEARHSRSDEPRPPRWGLRLPRLHSPLRRRAAAGAATA